MGKINLKAKFKDRKTWGTVIGIVIYLFCILFFTYAYYTWRSSDTDVELAITDSTATIEFENDGNVNAENIGPVLDYREGVSGGFKATNNTASEVELNIRLQILTISDNLKNDNFKYVMVKDSSGEGDYDYDNPIAIGDFSSFNIGVNLLTIDSIPSQAVYSYKIFVYIDGNVKNSLNMQDCLMLSVLTIRDYNYLSEMAPGSYVKYTGNNGCTGNACKGQNANYVSDTDMGYCYNSTYKYTVNGWRVGYVQENGKVALVSAGAPECMSRIASTNNVTFINDANEAALKYCNEEFVDGDCSTNSDAWAMGDTDFYYMTKVINGGYGKRLTRDSSSLGDVGGSTLVNTLYCAAFPVIECGFGNDLIDNGGEYWFASKAEPSTTNAPRWRAEKRFVNSYNTTYDYGIRPVISLSSSVYIKGGSGTYEDPYEIDVNQSIASEYIQNLDNDGSAITTVNIGGDTSKPQVNLNATQGIMLDNNGDYRYYGADPNNYVSYNDELWRIISVGNVKSSASDTIGKIRVKIVKADILTDDNGLNAFSYDSSASTVNSGLGVNDWSQADLMTELNTLYFNSKSGNCYTGYNNATTPCNFTNTGLSAEARNLTGDALYYLGGNSYGTVSYPNEYYTAERGTTVYNCSTNDGACPRTTTWTGRVGIIYSSDYLYATDLSVCTSTADSYSTTKCRDSNWLWDTSNFQLTISPYSSEKSSVVRVSSSGYIQGAGYGVCNAGVVRAVQYLRTEVTIVDGEGTSSNPYILGM